MKKLAILPQLIAKKYREYKARDVIKDKVRSIPKQGEIIKESAMSSLTKTADKVKAPWTVRHPIVGSIVPWGGLQAKGMIKGKGEKAYGKAPWSVRHPILLPELTALGGGLAGVAAGVPIAMSMQGPETAQNVILTSGQVGALLGGVGGRMYSGLKGKKYVEELYPGSTKKAAFEAGFADELDKIAVDWTVLGPALGGAALGGATGAAVAGKGKRLKGGLIGAGVGGALGAGGGAAYKYLNPKAPVALMAKEPAAVMQAPSWLGKGPSMTTADRALAHAIREPVGKAVKGIKETVKKAPQLKEIKAGPGVSIPKAVAAAKHEALHAKMSIPSALARRITIKELPSSQIAMVPGSKIGIKELV